jgi:antitoxin component YwqK of YwqJK toxin-antitoxin module
MQDKEINQRNEDGTRNKKWMSFWNNGNVANLNTYLNGKRVGHKAHYNVNGELIVAYYYAR